MSKYNVGDTVEFYAGPIWGHTTGKISLVFEPIKAPPYLTLYRTSVDNNWYRIEIGNSPFLVWDHEIVGHIKLSSENFLADTKLELVEPKKCECGAHSVGSNRHSSWCKLA